MTVPPIFLRTTFVLSLQATVLAAPPFIYTRSAVNSASLAATGLPNGALARGSIVTIFGRGLGPDAGAQAGYPVQSSLSGVSITVTQGSTSSSLLPLFVRADQINAVLPSDAPLGQASIQVAYQGLKSNPIPVKIVASSPGLYAVSSGGFGPGVVQNFVDANQLPVNSPLHSAKPGQVLILWGTGLGAINGSDATPPPAGDLPVQVEIFVGGKAAKRLYSGRSPCCSGVDQISLEVPPDVPTGCYVPVQIRTAGTMLSNTVTVAISADGASCSDPDNLLASQFRAGGKFGIEYLERRNVLVEPFVKAAVEVPLDAAHVSFRSELGGEFSFNPLIDLPPLGTCGVFGVRGDLVGANWLPGVTATKAELDAGASIHVTGPTTTIDLPRGVAGPKVYEASIAADEPLPSRYTVTAPGGAGVDASTSTVTPSPPLTWTNRAQFAKVDRSQSITLQWSATPPGASAVVIMGASTNLPSESSALFLCRELAVAGSFTVPSYILSALPSGVASHTQTGYLAIGALSDVQPVQASGIDAGYTFHAGWSGLGVEFR